ncbi:uclacyanin-3-like [Populus alba x Populus x berolinensis]|uniref:Uclacyanin-3-like n=1 Tax=Populus alba x Populus x berolinensis TaxID=444605 RepID=A0AAD6LRU6_9ROSI|nr:uclacyanin-3-like [Populus alba x Populus x berolinensis]
MANIASALLILVLAAPAAYAATTYTVGDSSGWTNFGDYTTWASGKTFAVGDSLLFKYGSSHSVAEVSKADYDSCSTSNILKSYTDGSSTVPLSTAGPMYFICSTPGHCSGGMKLAVTVVAASGTPSTPTTTSPPVSDGGSTTPSTTPSTTTTPPPPSKNNNGATSILYNMMLGVFLVFGTTVALMG